MNRLVARFNDGSMVKGMTLDFAPTKELFHVDTVEPLEGPPQRAIRMMDLKALFFVRDLAGDPLHVERMEFDLPPAPDERRIRAVFRDGEVMVGTTEEYRLGLPGFFLIPADPESNNRRCYVIATATQEVRFV